MTKQSDPQDLLRRTFGQTLPMQSDQRMQLDKNSSSPEQDEEQAGIRAEALRRLKVRQMSSGQLAPTRSSSPSPSNTQPQTE